jgi:hypothetical protein
MTQGGVDARSQAAEVIAGGERLHTHRPTATHSLGGMQGRGSVRSSADDVIAVPARRFRHRQRRRDDLRALQNGLRIGRAAKLYK